MASENPPGSHELSENKLALDRYKAKNIPVEDAVTYAPIMDFKYPGFTFRRRLDFPNFTVITSGGIQWAYYTNTIMMVNDFYVYDIPAHIVDKKAQCLADCIAGTYTGTLIVGNTPMVGGVALPKICNSCDWWATAGNCHHSYGTGCNPSPGYVKLMNPSHEAYYYEKYCVCGITANTLADKAYVFEGVLTDNYVTDTTESFFNTKSPDCELTSCKVLQSDCITALPAPTSTNR